MEGRREVPRGGKRAQHSDGPSQHARRDHEFAIPATALSTLRSRCTRATSPEVAAPQQLVASRRDQPISGAAVAHAHARRPSTRTFLLPVPAGR